MYYITYHLFHLTILALLGILEYLNYSYFGSLCFTPDIGPRSRFEDHAQAGVDSGDCSLLSSYTYSHLPIRDYHSLRCGGKGVKYLEQSIHNQKCVFSLGNRRTWFPPGRRS